MSRNRSRTRRTSVTCLVWLLAISLPGPAAVEARQDSLDDLASKAAKARDAGRLDEAIALYQQGVERAPDWIEGHWFLGASLYELGQFAQARDAFTRVLHLEPAHAGAFGMRGICAFHLGEHEQALRDLLRARTLGIATTPGVASPVRYHLGILLTRFGDFEVGYAVLSEFATQGTASPQVVQALGLNLLRRPALPGDIADAEAPLVELAGRAAFAMAARQAAAAQQLLEELVQRYPETPHVHYARGVFRLGEAPDLAMADFRRELAISTSHVPARLQLAFEFLRRGEPTLARPYAEEAGRLAPDYFAAHVALGQVHFESNELQKAIAEFELAVTLAPESAQTHFVLSRAYARAGRTEDAERERAEFVRLDQIARRQRSGPQSLGGAVGEPAGK